MKQGPLGPWLLRGFLFWDEKLPMVYGDYEISHFFRIPAKKWRDFCGALM